MRLRARILERGRSGSLDQAPGLWIRAEDASRLHPGPTPPWLRGVPGRRHPSRSSHEWPPPSAESRRARPARRWWSALPTRTVPPSQPWATLASAGGGKEGESAVSRLGPHNTADFPPLLRRLWTSVNLRDQNGDAQGWGVGWGVWPPEVTSNSRAAARELPAGNRRKTP